MKAFFLSVQILFLLCCVQQTILAQELRQNVRGIVIDSDTRTPLPFANIIIKTTQPVMGSMSDLNGVFRMDSVPIGRHDIQISYAGYETRVIAELLISSAKEVVLEIALKENILEMKEVVVDALVRKDKALNPMATLSARTVSVEEARRYAGGFDDPGRLVSSFAGVSTDVIRDNTIIIRGNSPKGLLWRLEGVEISNPNHFANLTTFGGGGVSSLSALVVGNSDFFTGAFPAEYGNALSGVFDVKLRSGNNEKHEHAFQAGTMGLDISSEGPLGKESAASYLFNYRYSTMALIRPVFPEEIKDFIPVYHDLCFKFNLPTTDLGVFSVWGLASEDAQDFHAEEDSTLWEMADDRLNGNMLQQMGGLGLNHRIIFGKNAYLSTSAAFTSDHMFYDVDFLGDDFQFYESEYMSVRNTKYSLASVFNQKFSASHVNRSGFTLDNMRYNTTLRHAPVYDQGLILVADEDDAANIVQVFTQSKLNLTHRWMLNAGLRGHYFNLNEEWVLEPRLGVSYTLSPAQTVGLAFGRHSRLEPLTLYFARVYDSGSFTQPNQDLKVSKAHHLVLAYDISFNPNLRLKVEPYYQQLFDVPVLPDSNFSVLNMEADWYFNEALINKGTGRNIGIDLTLERFLKDGYYYLITASFFDSKFKGDDEVERDTRFNTNYVVNLLYGKEWVLGVQQNRILGVNAKLNFFGGKRTTRVDELASRLVQNVVYKTSELYEMRESDKSILNMTVNYRINKPQHASIWSLQLMNMLLTPENYGDFYNYQTGKVERWEFAVPVPHFSYKIEF